MPPKKYEKIVANPFKNKNIGRRTGKDIKAGKTIRKTDRGFENFDDYWSESDVDTTREVVERLVYNNSAKESSFSANKSALPQPPKEVPSRSLTQQTYLKQNQAGNIEPVSAALNPFRSKQIGRRTGKDIKAGKNIRILDGGFENFDDYWSESDVDSVVSFSASSCNLKTGTTRQYSGQTSRSHRLRNSEGDSAISHESWRSQTKGHKEKAACENKSSHEFSLEDMENQALADAAHNVCRHFSHKESDNQTQGDVSSQENNSSQEKTHRSRRDVQNKSENYTDTQASEGSQEESQETGNSQEDMAENQGATESGESQGEMQKTGDSEEEMAKKGQEIPESGESQPEITEAEDNTEEFAKNQQYGDSPEQTGDNQKDITKHQEAPESAESQDQTEDSTEEIAEDQDGPESSDNLEKMTENQKTSEIANSQRKTMKPEKLQTRKDADADQKTVSEKTRVVLEPGVRMDEVHGAERLALNRAKSHRKQWRKDMTELSDEINEDGQDENENDGTRANDPGMRKEQNEPVLLHKEPTGKRQKSAVSSTRKGQMQSTTHSSTTDRGQQPQSHSQIGNVTSPLLASQKSSMYLLIAGDITGSITRLGSNSKLSPEPRMFGSRKRLTFVESPAGELHPKPGSEKERSRLSRPVAKATRTKPVSTLSFETQQENYSRDEKQKFDSSKGVAIKNNKNSELTQAKTHERQDLHSELNRAESQSNFSEVNMFVSLSQSRFNNSTRNSVIDSCSEEFEIMDESQVYRSRTAQISTKASKQFSRLNKRKSKQVKQKPSISETSAENVSTSGTADKERRLESSFTAPDRDEHIASVHKETRRSKLTGKGRQKKMTSKKSVSTANMNTHPGSTLLKSTPGKVTSKRSLSPANYTQQKGFLENSKGRKITSQESQSSNAGSDSIFPVENKTPQAMEGIKKLARKEMLTNTDHKNVSLTDLESQDKVKVKGKKLMLTRFSDGNLCQVVSKDGSQSQSDWNVKETSGTVETSHRAASVHYSLAPKTAKEREQSEQELSGQEAREVEAKPKMVENTVKDRRQGISKDADVHIQSTDAAVSVRFESSGATARTKRRRRRKLGDTKSHTRKATKSSKGIQQKNPPAVDEGEKHLSNGSATEQISNRQSPASAYKRKQSTQRETEADDSKSSGQGKVRRLSTSGVSMVELQKLRVYSGSEVRAAEPRATSVHADSPLLGSAVVQPRVPVNGETNKEFSSKPRTSSKPAASKVVTEARNLSSDFATNVEHESADLQSPGVTTEPKKQILKNKKSRRKGCAKNVRKKKASETVDQASESECQQENENSVEVTDDGKVFTPAVHSLTNLGMEDSALKSGISFRRFSRLPSSVKIKRSKQRNSGTREIQNDIICSPMLVEKHSHPAEEETSESDIKTRKSGKAGKKKRRITVSDTVISHSYQSHYGDGNSEGNTTAVSSMLATPIAYRRKSSVTSLSQLRNKIVFPRENTEGLRRSQRTRVRPLEWYKNERIIYDRRKSGPVVVAVQPSRELFYLQQKNLQRKKQQHGQELRKQAQSMKERLGRRLSTHIPVPGNLQVTSSTAIPVIHPESKEEMLMCCFNPQSAALVCGPHGSEPAEGDPFTLKLLSEQYLFTTGILNLAPAAEKPLQRVISTAVVFSITYGKVLVTINRATTILETGDHFFVPRGSAYSLKNLRKEEASLTFVNLMIENAEEHSPSTRKDIDS